MLYKPPTKLYPLPINTFIKALNSSGAERIEWETRRERQDMVLVFKGLRISTV